MITAVVTMNGLFAKPGRRIGWRAKSALVNAHVFIAARADVSGTEQKTQQRYSSRTTERPIERAKEKIGHGRYQPDAGCSGSKDNEYEQPDRHDKTAMPIGMIKKEYSKKNGKGNDRENHQQHRPGNVKIKGRALAFQPAWALNDILLRLSR